MNEKHTASNAKSLVNVIRGKAPEYLDLLTAENEEEFLNALDVVLEKAVNFLEINSKNFQALDEEGLTAVLGAALGIPGLSVTQETNSNGHVDLTIVADHSTPMRKILGEAKIYEGPVYHFGGLQQLLGRYITGRELRGLLIFYHRKQDIDGNVKKLRQQMNDDKPCQQTGDTRDHTLKWSFFSTHAHSSGATIEVGHIGCNLNVPTTTKK